MDALFREQMAHDTALLGSGRTPARSARSKERTTRRGASSGPQADCIMFTRDEVPFCAVCRRAIERVLDLYTA